MSAAASTSETILILDTCASFWEGFFLWPFQDFARNSFEESFFFHQPLTHINRWVKEQSWKKSKKIPLINKKPVFHSREIFFSPHMNDDEVNGRGVEFHVFPSVCSH